MSSGIDKHYEENKTRAQWKRVALLPFSAALDRAGALGRPRERSAPPARPVKWAVAPNARLFRNNTVYAEGLSGQSRHVVTST